MSEVKDAAEAAVAAPTKSTKTKGKKVPSAKKSTHKANGKAAPAEGGRSMARSCGETLLPLLKASKASKDALAIAKALADDAKVSKKQLTALRDAVNESAMIARDNEDTKLASQLSAANRTVRRLQRQA